MARAEEVPSGVPAWYSSDTAHNSCKSSAHPGTPMARRSTPRVEIVYECGLDATPMGDLRLVGAPWPHRVRALTIAGMAHLLPVQDLLLTIGSFLPSQILVTELLDVHLASDLLLWLYCLLQATVWGQSLAFSENPCRYPK